MEKQVHKIINDVFYDLYMCYEEQGLTVGPEELADCVCDQMCDLPEYRALPFKERRQMVLEICRSYF